MRDAFVRRLTELALKDARLMIVTGDLGFGVLTDFAERFPSQYLNAGVAEQNMTGVATGLALEGRTVFTYSIANFSTLRCLEQIRNDAAYHDANVKVVAIGGGFSYGSLGMSHHATEDLAIMRSLPITVVAPGCEWEAEEATSALTALPGTCYLRLDRTGASSTRRGDETFVIGQARTVRDGSAVTIVTTGGILDTALRAATQLEEEGITVRVVSMHTLKPFDAQSVLAAARETGGIVTVEEHSVFGGLGSAVAEACLDSNVVPRFFARIALRDGFSSIVGSQDYLRRHYGVDEQAIVTTIRQRIN